MTGAEITLLSSTMANGLPTFCCVASANLRAPVELKRKLTIGSLVRWSKPGCASTRSAAGDQHALLDQDISAPCSPSRISESGGKCVRQRLLRASSTDRPCENRASRSCREFPSAATGPAGRAPGPECGRAPSRWIVGSTRPEFVDAPFDDLDRLIDRLADTLDDRRVRRGQRNEAAVLGNVDAALSRRAEDAGQRLRQLAQLADRVVDVALARDAHLHAIAMDGAAGERNARLAQECAARRR